MRLHGRVGNLVGDEAGFGHMVGFGEAFVRIAEDVVIIFFQIVRLVLVDEVGLSLHRILGIEVGREDFIVDVDQLKGLIGGRFVYRGDTSHVVTHVANLLEGERVLVVADGKDSVGIGSVFAGYHADHSVEFFGAAGVDRPNAGVRIRRMQNSCRPAFRVE